MESNTSKRICEKFGAVWPGHVTQLARFLVECRRVFEGDLDMFLIMVVIGERTLPERRADQKIDFETWRTKGVGNISEKINASSIASYSGIPRETVRRKLAALAAKGWITCDEDGNYKAALKAATDLDPLTRTSIDYMAAQYDSISKIMGRADTA